VSIDLPTFTCLFPQITVIANERCSTGSHLRSTFHRFYNRGYSFSNSKISGVGLSVSFHAAYASLRQRSSKTSLRAYLHSHDSRLPPCPIFFLSLFTTGNAHKLVLRSYSQQLMADSSSHRLDLRVGGKYRLGKKIGSGSFGML
jgi:hypothetical protein